MSLTHRDSPLQNNPPLPLSEQASNSLDIVTSLKITMEDAMTLHLDSLWKTLKAKIREDVSYGHVCCQLFLTEKSWSEFPSAFWQRFKVKLSQKGYVLLNKFCTYHKYTVLDVCWKNPPSKTSAFVSRERAMVALNHRIDTTYEAIVKSLRTNATHLSNTVDYAFRDELWLLPDVFKTLILERFFKEGFTVKIEKQTLYSAEGKTFYMIPFKVTWDITPRKEQTCVLV